MTEPAVWYCIQYVLSALLTEPAVWYRVTVQEELIHTKLSTSTKIRGRSVVISSSPPQVVSIGKEVSLTSPTVTTWTTPLHLKHFGKPCTFVPQK
jgi:hypothetical protein